MDMLISKYIMDIYRYIEISIYIHNIQMLQLPDVEQLECSGTKVLDCKGV